MSAALPAHCAPLASFHPPHHHTPRACTVLNPRVSISNCQGVTVLNASHRPCLHLNARRRKGAHMCVRAGPFDWLSNLGKGGISVPDVEAEEAGTMRQMDGTGEAFGVQAVLLAGFMSEEEVADFQNMMNEMGATMFRVIPATKLMLQGTLREALEVPEVPAYEQPPLGTRRTVVLSGMYDGEVIEVVSAYRESGQPPAVFAAAVPNNMDRQLLSLMAEVHREDAAMRQQAARFAADSEQE